MSENISKNWLDPKLVVRKFMFAGCVLDNAAGVRLFRRVAKRILVDL